MVNMDFEPSRTSQGCYYGELTFENFLFQQGYHSG
jgi:hypothetical protein